MPPIARVGDMTTHGGVILGPGLPSVLIGGKPVAVAGDLHVCALPPGGHQPTVSPFPTGSATVRIGGRPVLRTTDVCGCGAQPLGGYPAVSIG